MAIDKINVEILPREKLRISNSISNTQFLSEVLSKLEEVINMVNSIQNEWDQDIAAAIENYNVTVLAMIESLRVYTNEQNDQLSNYLLGVIAEEIEQITNIVNSQNASISQIQQNVTNLQNYVESVRSYLISYTNQQVSILRGEVTQDIREVNERIDNIIEEYPPVYNPTTGQYESLAKVLDDMYSALAYNSVTAIEYDLLRLSATQFDSLLMSAYDYDINAKNILGFYDDKFFMTNPFTGEYVNYKVVINDIVDKIRTGSFTAAEFDAEQFTVTAYEGYDITALDFDTSGKEIMI